MQQHEIEGLINTLRVVAIASEDRLVAAWIQNVLGECDLEMSGKLAETCWGSAASSRYHLRAIIINDTGTLFG